MAPVNWGIASVKRNKSAWCMTRFGKLIDLYRPKALLIEVNDSPEAGPGNRVAVLAQDMRDRLPSPRRPWQNVDGRRCLFDAAALGIAHYRITRRNS